MFSLLKAILFSILFANFGSRSTCVYISLSSAGEQKNLYLSFITKTECSSRYRLSAVWCTMIDGHVLNG
jgi:hypothetical protein